MSNTDHRITAAALILAGACLLGLSLNLNSASSSLYTATNVVGTPATTVPVTGRMAPKRLQAMHAMERGENAESISFGQHHMKGNSQTWIGAAALGLAASAVALFMNYFRSAKKNSLNLAAYQAAEMQWSMAAATAFVGTQAPDFQATAVFDEEFLDIKLSQYRGKKYVVLFFYPLDFTFVCPTEITAFSDREGEFSAINTQILGVSVDSQFSHLAWVQTPRNEGGLGEIKYPLVADLKKEIAEAYGVLTEDGVALRGLFIIDKEGVIQHATINNLAFGRNVDETLRVLEAVQYVQAHPDEVCPAGWKKGDKTMKPDPEGSKEYFKSI